MTAKCGVILAALAALAAPGPAVAQYGGAAGGGEGAQAESRQGAKGEAKRRPAGLARKSLKSYEIDDRTSKHLNKARQAFVDEDYDGAEAALARLRERSLNPLERQQAYELRAYIKGARGDNAVARQHFESAIAQGTMTAQERANARFMVAQLYILDEMWPEAIENLNTWFEIATDPNAASYYRLAMARYQNGEFEAAIEPSQRAVDLTNEPQESWLQLLLALRLTQKDYEASVPLLETLVQRYPKKTYWVSLSTVHGALGDYPEALVPLQLAYAQGYLTEDDDLRRLAQLLLYLELPYRAAQVVVDGLSQQRIEADADVYELLGNCWIAAREFEKTVDPLSKAAELSEDGDLFVRLAQVQIAREKWAAAALALRRAIELGDLKRPGDAKLLMGIAVYNSDRPRQARTWFTQARAHEETRNEANQWLLHIEREQQPAS